MATLTPQNLSFAGLNHSFASADVGGDVFPNDGKCILLFTNANASSRTLTIAANDADKPGFGTISVPDTTVTIPGSGTNGGLCAVGPFPIDRFNNASGQCSLAYSAVTGLTVAVLRLPNPA